MASAGARAYNITGVWGQSPQRGSRPPDGSRCRTSDQHDEHEKPRFKKVFKNVLNVLLKAFGDY